MLYLAVNMNDGTNKEPRKTLTVKKTLHRDFKAMATLKSKSVEEATDEAVENWTKKNLKTLTHAN